MRGRQLTLKKPQLLCAPAHKTIPPNNPNGGGDPTAPFHPDQLLCYKTKGARFGTLGATIDNQFGPDQVTLTHRRELCVPSFKNPPPTTTTTSTTSTTTVTAQPTTTTSSTTPASTTTTTLCGSPSRALLVASRELLE